MRNSIRLLTTGIAFVILSIILSVFVAGDLIDNAKQYGVLVCRKSFR